MRVRPRAAMRRTGCSVAIAELGSRGPRATRRAAPAPSRDGVPDRSCSEAAPPRADPRRRPTRSCADDFAFRATRSAPIDTPTAADFFSQDFVHAMPIEIPLASVGCMPSHRHYIVLFASGSRDAGLNSLTPRGRLR